MNAQHRRETIIVMPMSEKKYFQQTLRGCRVGGVSFNKGGTTTY